MENEVIINGKKYIPAEAEADNLGVYYMHDNHTFSKLRGTTIDAILAEADIYARDSRCGMLCPVIVSSGKKELRRVGSAAHAPCCSNDKWEEGKAKWREEVEKDEDIMRLLKD